MRRRERKPREESGVVDVLAHGPDNVRHVDARRGRLVARHLPLGQLLRGDVFGRVAQDAEGDALHAGGHVDRRLLGDGLPRLLLLELGPHARRRKEDPRAILLRHRRLAHFCLIEAVLSAVSRALGTG